MAMKKSMQISGLIAALLVLSGGSLAAGLGKMSVQSALGQPLRAEIELLSVPADELGMVEAKLASPEAFRQARIDRAEAVAELRFTIDKRANGQPVVRIASASPINDPFVDLLIELNWSSGRVLREYTVLLDPSPGPKTNDEAMPAQPRVAPVTSAAYQPVPDATTMESVKGSGKAAAEAGQAVKEYGPVKAGDTLRGIAAKVAVPDVTLDMMMASLYQTNRQAFAKNNMNLLKKGQVLKVPERDAIMLMASPSQARQLIGKHAAAWHAMQGRVADQAARKMAEPAEGKTAGAGKIVPAQPQEKAPAQAAQKDVLRLSKGEPAKGVQADAGAAKRIQSLEEELAARNRSLREAQSRVSQLEGTVRDLQRLMELKAKEGAKVPAAKPAGKPDSPTAKADEPKPETKPAVKAPVPAPVEEEKSWFSTLLDNPLYLGGLAAAAALGVLLWVVMIGSRRRKGLSDFEQSIMSGGDQFKTSIFKTGSGAATQGGSATQSGMATDFSRLGLGSIDTHEVDPIAEAEVYMAYGRDAQAEEILKEALAKDPGRQEIAMKLLEIYAARQDAASFETQASELYAGLGGSGSPLWRKAAEMGRAIDPDNPLYRLFGEAPVVPEIARVPAEPAVETALEAVSSDEQLVEFDLPESEQYAETQAAVADAIAQPAPEEMVSDFDLSVEPEMTVSSPQEAEEPVTEFPSLAEISIGDLPPIEPVPLQSPEEPIPALEAEGSLLSGAESGREPVADFDLSAAMPEMAASAPALPELDFSGLDLELSDVQPSHGDELLKALSTDTGLEIPATVDADLLEEVNTKLDLAKAYLEMGDKEGAREILDEILKEGDDRQQQEAGRLMAELA